MNSCRKIRALFIEALYEELSPNQSASLEAHIKVCRKCETALARMKSTLQIMDERERPEPDKVFWTGYWDRLSDRIQQESAGMNEREVGFRRRFPALVAIPRWAAGAAGALALLIIGIFIGRNVIGPGSLPPHTGGIMAQPKIIAFNRAGEFIQRSKVLLMGITNFDPADEDPLTLNMPQQSSISQDLLQETTFIKEWLTDPDHARLVGLIEELERILMQIANLESESDLSAIELIKNGVESQGILLKINLEEMRRAAAGTGKTQDKKPKTSI